MRTALRLAIAFCAACALGGEPKPEGFVHSLADFGPLDPPAKAEETLQRALDALGQTGGVLLVPARVAASLKIENTSQGLVRIPPPPAPAKTWRNGPAATVVECGEGHLTVLVPPMDGLHISRTLRMAEGQSLPHWGTHPAVTLESRILHGSSSYLDWLQAPVEPGADRRFYVPSIRGIRPGQFLNVHGGLGYGGGVLRAYVKSLGYDPATRRHYLVADTHMAHKAGAIVHNKSNTGLLHMTQTSNGDNQTYDVKVIRNQYAHGDTYVYYCDFNYMSNVHSAAGDENGNCYGAFIRSLKNNLHGTVERIDWAKQELQLDASSRNLETLGDSRPLINLNPNKQIAAGKVWIVPPESSFGASDAWRFPFQGKTYPSRLVKNPISGATELKMGGLIRGDSACPWTEAVIGRFFALTDDGERVPGGNLRWYEITSLTPNADGTKDIEIRRYWWGAKSAGSPTLYSLENATWDGHLRPLAYAIAPGAWVADVSKAIPGGDRKSPRTLGLAPCADQGTPFDFAPGDPVEQAIGPDPFKPQAFRVWMWEDVPGAWPSAVLDFANHGAASRYAAMAVSGGGATLEDAEKRHERKPAWDNVVTVQSACTVGINFMADTAKAAILFQQPNREQPIRWHYGQEAGKPPKEASLTVSRATGALTFQGGGLCIEGGLSGAEEPARNLRGKGVPVKAGSTALHVAFPVPEADGDYAVFVEQTWLTARAVAKKAATGFTVQFASPAPEGAALDWMIVR